MPAANRPSEIDPDGYAGNASDAALLALAAAYTEVLSKASKESRRKSDEARSYRAVIDELRSRDPLLWRAAVVRTGFDVGGYLYAEAARRVIWRAQSGDHRAMLIAIAIAPPDVLGTIMSNATASEDWAVLERALPRAHALAADRTDTEALTRSVRLSVTALASTISRDAARSSHQASDLVDRTKVLHLGLWTLLSLSTPPGTGDLRDLLALAIDATSTPEVAVEAATFRRSLLVRMAIDPTLTPRDDPSDVVATAIRLVDAQAQRTPPIDDSEVLLSCARRLASDAQQTAALAPQVTALIAAAIDRRAPSAHALAADLQLAAAQRLPDDRTAARRSAMNLALRFLRAGAESTEPELWDRLWELTSNPLARKDYFQRALAVGGQGACDHHLSQLEQQIDHELSQDFGDVVSHAISACDEAVAPLSTEVHGHIIAGALVHLYERLAEVGDERRHHASNAALAAALRTLPTDARAHGLLERLTLGAFEADAGARNARTLLTAAPQIVRTHPNTFVPLLALSVELRSAGCAATRIDDLRAIVDAAIEGGSIPVEASEPVLGALDAARRPDLALRWLTHLADRPDLEANDRRTAILRAAGSGAMTVEDADRAYASLFPEDQQVLDSASALDDAAAWGRSILGRGMLPRSLPGTGPAGTVSIERARSVRRAQAPHVPTTGGGSASDPDRAPTKQDQHPSRPRSIERRRRPDGPSQWGA